MFDSDPRLMALLNAGSRKIKDAHREKVCTNGRTSQQGFHFLSLLDIYHHSLIGLWTYTNKINRLKRLSESLSTRFSRQALVTNRNSFVTRDVLRSKDPELMSCFTNTAGL